MKRSRAFYGCNDEGKRAMCPSRGQNLLLDRVFLFPARFHGVIFSGVLQRTKRCDAKLFDRFWLARQNSSFLIVGEYSMTKSRHRRKWDSSNVAGWKNWGEGDEENHPLTDMNISPKEIVLKIFHRQHYNDESLPFNDILSISIFDH